MTKSLFHFGSMHQRRRHLALLLSVLLVSGHVAGLQLLAWGGMFIDNLGRMPVAQALQRALAPESPCRICYAVEELRSDLQDDLGGTTKNPSPKSGVPKPDALRAIACMVPEAPVAHTRRSLPEVWQLPRSWREQPPVPPPQG